MIDLMFYVGVGFVLGAVCFTAYDFRFQRGKAGFNWVCLLSFFVSLLVDFVASPLLNVPGSASLVLFGSGSGYVVLSSFAFGVMMNFFVAKPLAYFTSKASVFNAGRGRTGSAGFWGRRAADVGSLKQPVTRKFRKLWVVLLFWRFWFLRVLRLQPFNLAPQSGLKGISRLLGSQFIAIH